MTASVDPQLRQRILIERLDDLRREHDQARADAMPQMTGDDADRATNVDGHVRLAVLESRIAAVEEELVSAGEHARHAPDAPIAVGDLVTIDLGDGPEQYLIGSVEQAGRGMDVITPGSPLGRAITSATVGETVDYVANGRANTARILSAE